MEIRAGPAACTGRANAPLRADNADAPPLPEEWISCSPTPSLHPPGIEKDPTSGRVNEGLAMVAPVGEPAKALRLSRPAATMPKKETGGHLMPQIRVCTHDGPGAQP